MNQRKNPLTRLHILAAAMSLVLLAYLGVLFDIQIVHHEDYLRQSTHSITREEQVDASRGIITDRMGRTLVSNRSTYSLTFDPSLLTEADDRNEAILRLVQLCRDQDIAWEDNLPISYHRPFIFLVDSLSNQQKSLFFSYLKELDGADELLSAYLDAHPELLEKEEDEKTSEETPSAPIDAFSGTQLTDALLKDAGITATQLVDWMREDMDIPETFSAEDARLVLGVRYELALRNLGNNMAYVLASDIDVPFISLLSDGNYAGAKVSRTAAREYETSYAAHVLGTVGAISSREEFDALGEGYNWNDQVGKSGAEGAFEAYLKGTDGRRVLSVNDSGKVTGEYYATEPHPGNTVELTLDLELQKAVEDALAETVEAMNASDDVEGRGAGAAVIEVGTGEVLALASYPTYDLSTFRSDYNELLADPASPLVNRATQGTYPPGSTLKPFTAAASVEAGVTTLTERIRDVGKWLYPGDPNRLGSWCWNRSGHGSLTVSQAIANSCNYFFSEMGYRLGMDRLREGLGAFGLGASTGIEIGDSSGLLPSNPVGENQAPWAAYGQSNQLYTPIQLANALATLVSGGQHYDAHLLKTVKTYDNTQVVTSGAADPTHTVDLQESTVNAVKKGMLDYTQPGGMVYSYFKDCIVTAGAKTGTAQIGTNLTNNGVFVCFAPYDDPEIALSIVIEKGGSGAALASTAVKIINAYFSSDKIGIALLPENQLVP